MILAFLAVAGILLVGVELMSRYSPMVSRYSRRITHAGAALIAIVAPYFVSGAVIVYACLAFAGIMLTLRFSSLLPSVHAVRRESWGDVFFPLGEAMTAYLFLPHSIAAFQFGIAVLGLSDVAAGVVGERWGVHAISIVGQKKTLEGAAAFFVTTITIGLMFGAPMNATVVGVSGLLTTLELLLVFGADNLLIPVVAAALFQLL